MDEPSINQNSKYDFEVVKELLTVRLEQMHTYHDHKEKMAHAGILVELVLMGAVLGTDNWPLDWVPDLCIPKRYICLFGLFLIWILIHIYIRWQLRNRRIAALYVAGLLELFKDWAYKKPTDKDLKPYKNVGDTIGYGVIFPETSNFSEFIDKYLFPLEGVFIPTDEGMKDYPTIMVVKIIKALTGAVTGERLVTFASIIVFLICLFRALS